MKQQSLMGMLGSAMGLRLAMAALNFGLFWVLSHRLDSNSLGGFSLLMNIFLLLQLLPLLGLAPAFIRRAAAEHENIQVELSNGVAFALPVAVVLGVGIGVIGQTTYGAELHASFWLIALAMLPTAWIQVAEVTLLGRERMADIARVQGAEAFLRFGGALLVLQLGGGLTGIFAVITLLRFAVGVAYALLPELPRPRWRDCQLAIWYRHWHEVPMYLGIALLAGFTSRLDVIVLSRLQGLHEVAIYAAAARLYDAALMLPTVAALTMMPALARLFASDRDQFGRLLTGALRASLGVGMLVALVVSACSELIIGVLYAPGMLAASDVLRWLIFGAVFMTADQVLSTTMLAARAQAHDFRALALSLVWLVIGLFWLVPLWGPRGVAIAVTLTPVIRVAYRLRWAATALDLGGLWRDYVRQLAALTAGLVAMELAWSAGIVWRALAGCGAWLLAAAVVGLVHRGLLQDWRAGWTTLRRRQA